VRRGRAGGGEQAPDLGVVSGIFPGSGGGRCLVRGDRGRSLGIGAVPELGGGDSADRQGGHDQHDVTQDCGMQPALALVQAEAVLAGERNPLPQATSARRP
jgi:hypothetical protein